MHLVSVHFLEARHRKPVAPPVDDAGGSGTSRRHRGETGHLVCEGGGTDVHPVGAGPRPLGVFTTNCTRPVAMRSTASNAPDSPTLATTRATGMSLDSRKAAVPDVATSSKPSSAKVRAASRPPALSRSASDRNTAPSDGSRVPAAIWLLAKASPNVEPMPMTSPVERISGPSRVSTPGKRSKGSTASLTLTHPSPVGGRSTPSARSSANVAPVITLAATMATGTPVALATKGTVRLARGLASRT